MYLIIGQVGQVSVLPKSQILFHKNGLPCDLYIMTIAAFEGHHIAANFSWKMGVKCAPLDCTNKKKRHFMYLQGSLSLKASCLMLNSVSWIKEDLSSDKAACSSSCEANSFSSSSPSSLVRIFCFNFSLNPLRNSLLGETDNAALRLPEFYSLLANGGYFIEVTK